MNYKSAISWFEIPASDLNRAAKFYETIMGVQLIVMDMPGMSMRMFPVADMMNDIGGAIGWMALEHPFQRQFKDGGCFESSASGEGIARAARKIISVKKEYDGLLKTKSLDALTAFDVFEAYENKDTVAEEVLHHCIKAWGIAVANLVSLFNPQKIVFGGGVFGPAAKFIPDIKEEAMKWAQPISMQHATIETSGLGTRAGLYGAACIAKQSFKT